MAGSCTPARRGRNGGLREVSVCSAWRRHSLQQAVLQNAAMFGVQICSHRACYSSRVVRIQAGRPCHWRGGGRRSKHADPRFPVGKARLEAVGVILCACVMTLSSFEVIRSSGCTIYAGWFGGGCPPSAPPSPHYNRSSCARRTMHAASLHLERSSSQQLDVKRASTRSCRLFSVKEGS